MKRQKALNIRSDLWCLSWLLIVLMVLALGSCGAPTPSASEVAPAVPTMAAVAPLTPSALAATTAVSATVTAAPAPSDMPATATQEPAPGGPTTSITPSITLPRLAFRSTGIYVITVDGTHLTRLTTAAPDRLPAWSPDRRRIAFSSDRDDNGNAEIFVINVDGSGETDLTSDPAGDSSPVWSPDGQFIAFTSNRASKTPYGDIYVMRADGTQAQRVTIDPTFENILGWSPDSSRIFYSILTQDNVWTIHVVNRDGTHDTALVHGSAGILSPDGSTIAFIREESGQGGVQVSDVWVSQVDGTNVRRLTRTATVKHSLTWSPDSKRIGFNPGIVVVNVDGSGQTQLSDMQTSSGEMHWSPDGRYIAFQAADANNKISLAVVDVTTGIRTVIMHDMGVEAGFAWAPQ